VKIAARFTEAKLKLNSGNLVALLSESASRKEETEKPFHEI
jgi:hypothetical protein